jgi:hypothetical protein
MKAAIEKRAQARAEISHDSSHDLPSGGRGTDKTIASGVK